METDELYTVKNNFWLGNFQDAISEAKSLRSLKTDALRIERDVYIYRSQIGLRNFRAVLDELRDDASTAPALRAVRLLGMHASGSRAAAVEAIEAALADGRTSSDATLQTIAAHVFILEGNYPAALKALRSPQGLEHAALLCQLHLRIDRPDLAEASVKDMQATDDEAALTILAAAQVALVQGGGRIKEACALFRELNERFGASVCGVNGLAAVYIAQHKYADAERVLEEFLESQPNQPDALINLITAAVHTGRADAAAKWTAALRAAAPTHPYLQQTALLEGTFDRVATAFGV